MAAHGPTCWMWLWRVAPRANIYNSFPLVLEGHFQTLDIFYHLF
jgi:hypothetical protein